MGLLDSITDILGSAVEAAPSVLAAINEKERLEIQREAAKKAPAQIKLRSADPRLRYSPSPYYGGTQLPTYSTAPYQRVDYPFSNGGGLLNGDIPGMDIAPQGGAELFEPFGRGYSGARAQAHVAVNPASGRLTWFKPAGRPVLWSGDLTAAKRVRKIAARARRSSR